MKRRKLIKLSGLALAGTALRNLNFSRAEPTYHFIAVGSWGGRILKAFESYTHPCKYTWITDQDHTDCCDLESVKRIVHKHLYTEKYFKNYRIKEFPDEMTQLNLSRLSLEPDDVHIILSHPTSFLSYCVLPQLVRHIDGLGLNHHSIISQPFHFYQEMWQKSFQETAKAIGDNPGKLTIFLADSLRGRKEKMNLDEAFNFMCGRFFEEFMELKKRNQFRL